MPSRVVWLTLPERENDIGHTRYDRIVEAQFRDILEGRLGHVQWLVYQSIYAFDNCRSRCSFVPHHEVEESTVRVLSATAHDLCARFVDEGIFDPEDKILPRVFKYAVNVRNIPSPPRPCLSFSLRRDPHIPDPASSPDYVYTKRNYRYTQCLDPFDKRTHKCLLLSQPERFCFEPNGHNTVLYQAVWWPNNSNRLWPSVQEHAPEWLILRILFRVPLKHSKDSFKINCTSTVEGEESLYRSFWHSSCPWSTYIYKDAPGSHSFFVLERFVTCLDHYAAVVRYHLALLKHFESIGPGHLAGHHIFTNKFPSLARLAYRQHGETTFLYNERPVIVSSRYLPWWGQRFSLYQEAPPEDNIVSERREDMS